MQTFVFMVENHTERVLKATEWVAEQLVNLVAKTIHRSPNLPTVHTQFKATYSDIMINVVFWDKITYTHN